MSEESPHESSNTDALINELIVRQTTRNDINEHDSQNLLLSQLCTELYSFNNNSLTPSMLDKYEDYFVKLTRLLSTSSSPSVIRCCLIMLEKLLLTGYLSQSMERNKSKCHEYYTLSMDALNIKENLDYLQVHQNSSSDLFKTLTYLYLYLARETIRFRNRASELLTVQEWNLRTSCFEDKYKPFLKTLLSFIDKKLNANENITDIIGFFITSSDDINLIPNLVEGELPQHLKHWLSTYINNKELEDNDLSHTILLIINNVARHEEGSNIFKDIRMSDVLQDFWKLCQKDLPKDSIALYYMAYALIVTPEQLKSAIVLHDVIDYLIENINIASCSSNIRTDSAHISEYLVALARLIVNDNVAQYIINTCKINKTTDVVLLSDDCWEEIGRAIKYALFVLIIVSPSYCQSISCRKEAVYADKRKKPLIAIYPNDDKYEPDEWLDIRLSGSYVRFGKNEKSFDDSISRLLEYIRPNESEVINMILPKTPSTSLQQSHDLPKPTEVISPIVSQSTKLSVHDWTKHDVERWFLIERNLLPELYKLYLFVDGGSLLEYAKYFIQEYEQDSKRQYEKLSERLHKEFNIEFYDNNYTDLVCSMKKLLLIYDEPSLMMAKTKNQKPSSLCLIL